MAPHAPPEPPAPLVRRRWVGYVSGFDPQGPSHYHRLYTEQGARQAAVSGYQLTVGPRRKDGPWAAWWTVHWNQGAQHTETRYEFLRWDDLVRAEWPRGPLGLLRAVAGASWGMWRNGVMIHSLRRSWPAFLAMGLPGLLLLLGLVLALGAVTATVGLLREGQWAGAALLLALTAGVLAGGARWLDARHHMAWLMRSMASLLAQGRGQRPAFDRRWEALAERVLTAVRSGDYDEVLLVGHSSGAMQAMTVAAHTLRGLADQPSHCALGLLTLGHCTPLLSQPASAVGFRADLRTLLERADLDWIDYSAPPDGCCFALVDPTEACGSAETEAGRPKLLNPRFASQFGPTEYRAIRQDKYRCHFQYLMAGAVPAAYDFYLMTAGPLTLAQRHAGQGSVTGFHQFQLFGGR